MRKYFFLFLGGALCFAAGVLCTVFFNGKTGFVREKPNVLVITLDTTRSDHLACYGYPKIKTPNIDSLAEDGVLFETAISQAPLTVTSHSTIFTSTYPQFHDVRDNGGYRLGKSAVTLAEILHDQGYDTAAFVSAFVLHSKFGLNQGFDTYSDVGEIKDKRQIIKFMEGERTADKTVDEALGWLGTHADKKFFLWLHLYDPHHVYNPPAPYDKLYTEDLYDGEIAFADAQIGRILSFLKEKNLKKNTLIAFMSDHGESLGEHGESAHAIFIYDATQKVPLIFSYPGKIPAHKKIGGQVRLVDVMPTVLDLLGVRKNGEIQGKSLASYIRGNFGAPDFPAYSESLYAKHHFNWDELIAWRSGGWQYIKSSEPELFDLKADPRELKNLAASNPAKVEKMDKELSAFLARTTSKEPKNTKFEMDGQTKAKLMSLGYLQGGGGEESAKPVPRKMVQVMEKINYYAMIANSGQMEKAIEGFKEVLKLDPDNVEVYTHLGQCYQSLKKYEEAIGYFKKATSFKAEEPDAHDGLGNIYKSMGRVDQAFEEFKIAAQLDPDNAAIINNIGWCHQQKMEFDEAMSYYDKALKLDPEIATAYANLAICHRIKGDVDRSIEESKKAIALDPELSFAHAELCAALATKGDLDGAIPYCEKAIKLDPEGVDGYNNLGVCYERIRDYEKALKNYANAAELAPWNSLFYNNMGNVYSQSKRYNEAIESYKKALQINPNDKQAAASLHQVLSR